MLCPQAIRLRGGMDWQAETPESTTPEYSSEEEQGPFGRRLRMPLTRVAHEQGIEGEGEESGRPQAEPAVCNACLRFVSQYTMHRKFPRWWMKSWVYNRDDLAICPQCCGGPCRDCGGPAWPHDDYIFNHRPLRCGAEGAICGMAGLERVQASDALWQSPPYIAARAAIKAERHRGLTATPTRTQSRWLRDLRRDEAIPADWDEIQALRQCATNAGLNPDDPATHGGVDGEDMGRLLELVMNISYGPAPLTSYPACYSHATELLQRPVSMAYWVDVEQQN